MSWLLVALMVAGAALVYAFTRAPGDRMLADALRRTSLPLIPAVQDRLVRRMRHRGSGIAIGALVAAGITAAIVLLEPDAIGGWPYTPDPFSTGSPFAPMLCAGIFIACASIGAAVAAFGPFAAVSPDAVHIARATSPRLADYLAGFWRWLPRAVVAAALLGYAACLIRPSAASATQPAATLAPIFVVAGIVAAVAAELLSARLLRVPQPAGTADELAWDDALRAMALREIWMAPLALGAAAAVCVTGLAGATGVAGLVAVPLGLLPLVSMIANPGARFHGLWAGPRAAGPAPAATPPGPSPAASAAGAR